MTILGDLVEIYDGPHATPTRRDSGPYFLNISSLKSGRLDLGESDHVSEEDFIRWTRRMQPRVGDLLFSYETRLGEAALMPDGVRACLGRRMGVLRPDQALLEPRYLLYYFLSPLFQELISERTVHGATVPRLLLSEMASWPVEVPDLATQTAIADVLGALDDKIAANEWEIRLLDELSHALTLAALVRGQRQFALKDFADLTMGSSPTGATLSEDATGVAFHQGVRDFGIRQPTDRIFTSAPVRMARVGDVLISVRAPVGRLNRAATDLCIGRGLAAARSRHCSGATLYNLLRAAPDLWEAHGSDGTVFASISRPQLENLPVGVPDELGLLDERLTVLEARVDLLAVESARLAVTRDALLPELMSGRLTIRTLEDSVR